MCSDVLLIDGISSDGLMYLMSCVIWTTPTLNCVVLFNLSYDRDYSLTYIHLVYHVLYDYTHLSIDGGSHPLD